MVHSMVVKHWPITKVKSMLEATLMPAPAARVSRGWISLQQPRHLYPCQTHAGGHTHAPSMCECTRRLSGGNFYWQINEGRGQRGSRGIQPANGSPAIRMPTDVHADDLHSGTQVAIT